MTVDISLLKVRPDVSKLVKILFYRQEIHYRSKVKSVLKSETGGKQQQCLFGRRAGFRFLSNPCSFFLLFRLFCVLSVFFLNSWLNNKTNPNPLL